MSHDRDVKRCNRCGKELWDGATCDCRAYVAQEGGDHYQAEYQHWDWVIDCQLHYLVGNCTKYVSRWRKKHGIEDLNKAMSYLDKMIAVRMRRPEYIFNHGKGYTIRSCTDRIVETLGLFGDERGIFEILIGQCPLSMIELAKERLANLIRTAKMAQEAGFDLNAPNPYCPPPRPAAGPKQDVPGRAGGMVGQGAASSASREVGGINHPAPFGYEGDE
ncbi:MAG: hypothetical protein Unbinned200contig1000_44 [Prokaryotic dsDNA virus sp.]|jgi:hypothetical protein|nr:hypothetical protein [Flavobacteriaceae bacterium]QDP65304.1 MAG: hypothetical protein Unbinned200contig1000_44 [Prokaryotic dsDNA virus sp.]|tara:strand:+ start:51941 stop:52594 length:654 start_codon:yes stop_codon:yes gene_type:complete